MTKNKKRRLNKKAKGNYSRRKKLRNCSSWAGDNRTHQSQKFIEGDEADRRQDEDVGDRTTE